MDQVSMIPTIPLIIYIETLDAEEVFQMLEQNNIDIPIPILKSLFAVVKPRHPGELRMGEFIKFSFDEHANKSKKTPQSINH